MASIRTPLSEAQLAERLDRLNAEFQPIKSCAKAQLPTEIFLQEPDGVLLLRPQPEDGPEAFALVLYSAVEPAMASRYEALHRICLPKAILQMLTQMNGGRLFELNIFGIPPSMARDPPLLDRERRQPFDIGTAASNWIYEYPEELRDGFHFGSRNIGWNRQIGYFLMPDGTVLSCGKGEEMQDVRTWNSLPEWLDRELDKTQRDHAAYRAEVRHKEAELNEAHRKKF